MALFISKLERSDEIISSMISLSLFEVQVSNDVFLFSPVTVTEWDYWTSGYKGDDAKWHWGRRARSIKEDGKQ